MNFFKRILLVVRPGLLSLVVLAIAPAIIEAAGIAFRNDCPYPVYVQGSTIVNGQPRRGPLLLIKPGQTVWDVNLTKGSRTIAVYTTANQKLFMDTRVFPGTDQFYTVVPVAVPRGQPPRCDLKEMLPPPAK
jgi:hypothetical protein